MSEYDPNDEGPQETPESKSEKRVAKELELLAEGNPLKGIAKAEKLKVIEYRRALSKMEPLALATMMDILKRSKYHNLKLQVARDILDRIHGKATERVELTDVQKRLAAMTNDELAVYLRSLVVEAGLEEAVVDTVEVPVHVKHAGPVN